MNILIFADSEIGRYCLHMCNQGPAQLREEVLYTSSANITSRFKSTLFIIKLSIINGFNRKIEQNVGSYLPEKIFPL